MKMFPFVDSTACKFPQRHYAQLSRFPLSRSFKRKRNVSQVIPTRKYRISDRTERIFLHIFLIHTFFFPYPRQARIASDLIELRNKSVFAFFMFNALFVLIVFLLQLNKDQLHVIWPFGVKTNITFIEETSEVPGYFENEKETRKQRYLGRLTHPVCSVARVLSPCLSASQFTTSGSSLLRWPIEIEGIAVDISCARRKKLDWILC